MVLFGNKQWETLPYISSAQSYECGQPAEWSSDADIHESANKLVFVSAGNSNPMQGSQYTFRLVQIYSTSDPCANRMTFGCTCDSRHAQLVFCSKIVSAVRFHCDRQHLIGLRNVKRIPKWAWILQARLSTQFACNFSTYVGFFERLISCFITASSFAWDTACITNHSYFVSYCGIIMLNLCMLQLAVLSYKTWWQKLGKPVVMSWNIVNETM